MNGINLLPWREERKKLRQKQFYGMLSVAAGCGLLISALTYGYFSSLIAGQNDRNAYLETEIKKVEADINQIKDLDEQREKLLARKEVIEKLQLNRSLMTHMFDSLVRSVPSGVMLTDFKQEGDKLTINGRAESNTEVSNYMRMLASTGWLSNPELTIIEAQSEPDKSKNTAPPVARTSPLPYVFTLQVKIVGNVINEDGEPTKVTASDGGEPQVLEPLPVISSESPTVQPPLAETTVEEARKAAQNNPGVAPSANGLPSIEGPVDSQKSAVPELKKPSDPPPTSSPVDEPIQEKQKS